MSLFTSGHSGWYHSMRPNIFLFLGDDSAQHRRWYYEVVVDHLDPFVTSEPTHLRVGWASTEGYRPRPSGGEGWGSNGVGDDLCSYGFDGLHLWSGRDSGYWEQLDDLLRSWNIDDWWQNASAELQGVWAAESPLPSLIHWKMVMLSAVVLTSVLPASPSESTVFLFRACWKILLLKVFSILLSVSLLVLSE